MSQAGAASGLAVEPGLQVCGRRQVEQALIESLELLGMKLFETMTQIGIGHSETPGDRPPDHPQRFLPGALFPSLGKSLLCSPGNQFLAHGFRFGHQQFPVAGPYFWIEFPDIEHAAALQKEPDLTQIYPMRHQPQHVLGYLLEIGASVDFFHQPNQDHRVVQGRVGIKFNLILLQDPGAKTILPTIPSGYPTWGRLALFRRFPGTKRQLQNPTNWV